MAKWRGWEGGRRGGRARGILIYTDIPTLIPHSPTLTFPHWQFLHWHLSTVNSTLSSLHCRFYYVISTLTSLHVVLPSPTPTSTHTHTQIYTHTHPIPYPYPHTPHPHSNSHSHSLPHTHTQSFRQPHSHTLIHADQGISTESLLMCFVLVCVISRSVRPGWWRSLDL